MDPVGYVRLDQFHPAEFAGQITLSLTIQIMQPFTFFGIEIKDWAVVFATLVGPILAIQAQKAIEALRERRHRKTYVFEQLMASRRARLSPEHVRALNMIDLVFYGQRVAGVQRRSAAEQRVLDCWKEYLDHLNNRNDDEPIAQWVTKGDELFTNILHAISADIGYRFDRVQLKRGAYSPIAHGELEEEQNELRKATLSLVTGKSALKMNVVAMPVDPEVASANAAAIQRLGSAVQKGAIQVEIVGEKAPE